MNIKTAKTLLTPLLLIALMTGCISQYTTPMRTQTVTLAYPPKTAPGDVIENTLAIGREMKFPPATKLDKTGGMVEFGNFGLPMIGITAQARIKSEGQLEVTIVRYTPFVPMDVTAEMEEFESKFKTSMHEDAVVPLPAQPASTTGAAGASIAGSNIAGAGTSK